TVSAPSSDPNPANNSATAVFTTPAPLSITVSPKQLAFGFIALNNPSSQLSISVTNSGKSAFLYKTPAVTGPFFEVDDSCTGRLGPGVTTEVLVTPGTTCVSTLTFTPTSLGPATGAVTFMEADDVGQSAQQIVPLSGVGSNVGIQPSSLIFSSPQ